MKRRYKFTDKNQSRLGMLSCAAWTVSLLLTGGVVAAAYMEYGQAGKFIAVLGFLAILLSLAGMYYGIRGLMEEDTYQLFPYLGCVQNGVVLTAYVMVYILGW